MKNKSLLLFSLSLATPWSLFATEWNVSVQPFQNPGSFVFAEGDLNFRFAELATMFDPGSNTSTHMLVSGLLPATGADNVYASNYEAIDINNGEVQDAGAFYVNLPESIQSGAPPLSSAIVGVVPRQGSWSNYSPSTPSQTTIGGATGTATMSSGSISMQLNRNGQTGSASIAFSMPDNDTLELDGFTLNFGGSNYPFDPTVLLRDEDRFYGTIASADPVEYQSLMFVLELSGGAPGEIPLEIGRWIDDHRLGMLFGVQADWAHSLDFGWLNLGDFPWMYHPELGWLSYQRGDNSSALWLYSPDLEWIYVPENRDGSFLHSSGDWASGSFF